MSFFFKTEVKIFEGRWEENFQKQDFLTLFCKLLEPDATASDVNPV